MYYTVYHSGHERQGKAVIDELLAAQAAAAGAKVGAVPPSCICSPPPTYLHRVKFVNHLSRLRTANCNLDQNNRFLLHVTLQLYMTFPLFTCSQHRAPPCIEEVVRRHPHMVVWARGPWPLRSSVLGSLSSWLPRWRWRPPLPPHRHRRLCPHGSGCGRRSRRCGRCRS
jgi:hypothetical protein